MIKFLDLEKVNNRFRKEIEERIKTKLEYGLKIAYQDFLSKEVRSK